MELFSLEPTAQPRHGTSFHFFSVLCTILSRHCLWCNADHAAQSPEVFARGAMSGSACPNHPQTGVTTLFSVPKACRHLAWFLPQHQQTGKSFLQVDFLHPERATSAFESTIRKPRTSRCQPASSRTFEVPMARTRSFQCPSLHNPFRSPAFSGPRARTQDPKGFLVPKKPRLKC